MLAQSLGGIFSGDRERCFERDPSRSMEWKLTITDTLAVFTGLRSALMLNIRSLIWYTLRTKYNSNLILKQW